MDEILYSWRWGDSAIDAIPLYIGLFVGIGTLLLVPAGALSNETVQRILNLNIPDAAKPWALTGGAVLIAIGLGILLWNLAIGPIRQVGIQQPDVLVVRRFGVLAPDRKIPMSTLRDARVVQVRRGRQPYQVVLTTTEGQEIRLVEVWQDARDKVLPIVDRVQRFLAAGG